MVDDEAKQKSESSGWEKLPPLDGGSGHGCLNCPGKPHALPMSTVLAVGFGMVTVTKGDEVVWVGDDEHRWLRRYERMAAADPDHDWRVEFIGPLSESTYQRQGEREWVLVERGMGFA